MKANELRIGNWVHSPFYKDYEIVALSVLGEGNELFFKSLDYYPKSCRLKDIKPIKLNDLWLLRFGFKLFNDGGELVGDDMFWIHPKMKGSVNHGTYIWNICGVKIRYVHQLQNLYFALTGVELQLSST